MLWRKEIFSHLLVAFVYFFLVSVLRWKLDWGVLMLWLGVLLGTFFLDIDHLIYWLVTHPEAEDSREVMEVWRTRGTRGIRRIREILENYHQSHNRLVFHSALGQVVLLILAVFVLTSGGSIFGSAFIMAINLHLLKDEWTDFGQNKDRLADWLFWQIREPKLKEYLKEYLVVASLLFLGLTGLLVRG
ncbi:MAG: hypothetical protein ACPLY7_00440 [Microgenomates group bacterium]